MGGASTRDWRADEKDGAEKPRRFGPFNLNKAARDETRAKQLSEDTEQQLIRQPVVVSKQDMSIGREAIQSRPTSAVMPKRSAPTTALSPRSVIAAEPIGATMPQQSSQAVNKAVDSTPPKKSETDFSKEDIGQPYKHWDRVQGMVDKALSNGDLRAAQRIQERYNQLLKAGFESLDTKYKTELAPRVQQMKQVLMDHQEQKLPRDIAMEAKDLTQKETAQREQQMAYVLKLATNPMTKHLGIEFANKSGTLFSGVNNIGDVRRNEKTKMYEVIDTSGGLINVNGHPAAYPIAEADALVNKVFPKAGIDKERYIKTAPGERIHDLANGGKVIANNPDNAAGRNGRNGLSDGQLLDNARADTKMTMPQIANHFGAKLSANGNEYDLSQIKDPRGYYAALAKVENLVRQQVPPMAAQQMVLEELQRALLIQAAGGKQSSTASQMAQPIEQPQQQAQPGQPAAAQSAQGLIDLQRALFTTPTQ